MLGLLLCPQRFIESGKVDMREKVKSAIIAWLGMDDIKNQLDRLREDHEKLKFYAEGLTKKVEAEKVDAQQRQSLRAPWPQRRAYLEISDGGRKS